MVVWPTSNNKPNSIFNDKTVIKIYVNTCRVELHAITHISTQIFSCEDSSMPTIYPIIRIEKWKVLVRRAAADRWFNQSPLLYIIFTPSQVLSTDMLSSSTSSLGLSFCSFSYFRFASLFSFTLTFLLFFFTPKNTQWKSDEDENDLSVSIIITSFDLSFDRCTYTFIKKKINRWWKISHR